MVAECRELEHRSEYVIHLYKVVQTDKDQLVIR
jgi:hypothetical protein